MKQQGLHVTNSGETTIYLRRHSMKVIGDKREATFPEYVFVHDSTLAKSPYLTPTHVIGRKKC